MPSYPKLIQREMLRINQKWSTVGVPEWLPFLRGSEESFLRVHVQTPPCHADGDPAPDGAGRPLRSPSRAVRICLW
jgi:hypothetical protein